MSGSPDVGAMVLAALLILNVMMSAPRLLLESIMACRNDPGPLSLVFVTTNVLGGGSSPRIRLQPPPMLPPGKVESMTAYRRQVPFGSLPLKAERAFP